MAKAKAQETAPDRGEAYEGETEVQAEEVVSHAVVPRSTAAVATIDDIQALMLDDAGQDLGFEKGDVALPFFRVLQSNSPQAMRKNPKYVEDALPGFFYNTATNNVYDGDKGVDVIPVHFMKQATLWKPRVGDAGQPTGGGFVREISLEEGVALLKHCIKNDKNKDITPLGYKDPQGQDNAGLELVIAAMYYVLLFDKASGDGVFEAVAMPMASTQMKKSRSWNAVIQNARLPHPSGAGSYRAPMFGFCYHITTIPESNNKGEWMGVKIKQDQPLIKVDANGVPLEQFKGAANLYLAARDFKALVASGKVKVKQEDADYESEVVSEGGGADDENAPF